MSDGTPIIVKKKKVQAPAHHGGSWKVAYADFVTAMMAFFLLMWLLNATTEEQRRGLADYFAPTNLFSHGSSGTGQPFGGHTAFDTGSMVSDRGSVQVIPGNRPAVTDEGFDQTQQAPVPGDADAVSGSAAETVPDQPAARPVAKANGPPGPGAPAGVMPDGPPDGPIAWQAALARTAAQQAAREAAAFQEAAREIGEAVRNDPQLAELAKQLAVDVTPEGLRIQIMDEERRPMFALGSAEPNERARQLVQKLTPLLIPLRHAVSIAGHTDAAPFTGTGRSNWELSAERANTTRKLLMDGGFPEQRIRSVTGNADHDLLLPSDPLAAANRRIAIVVLREAPAHPPDAPAKH